MKHFTYIQSYTEQCAEHLCVSTDNSVSFKYAFICVCMRRETETERQTQTCTLGKWLEVRGQRAAHNGISLVLFMYQSGQVYLYEWLNSLYNAMKWVIVLLSPVLQKRKMRFSFVCKVVQSSMSNQQSLNVYIQQSQSTRDNYIKTTNTGPARTPI